MNKNSDLVSTDEEKAEVLNNKLERWACVNPMRFNKAK